ncbi:unnamed protein product, partial [Brachionus calyciflorus]
MFLYERVLKRNFMKRGNMVSFSLIWVFASGLENGDLQLWDYDSSSLLYNLSGHVSTVRSIEYLSNNLLASG